ncbi:MAG: PilZ domain-containing protein [Nitrospira sp.]|nr:PilZ domain-containing protein [Nitrospira sp.]
MTTPTEAPSTTTQDERREWIRIDDRVLMEYRLLMESGHTLPVEADAPTADMISTVVGKPTAELLARSGDSLAGSPVLPWIMKVDYLLEVILNALAASRPDTVAMARLMDVNLSGGGVGFVSDRELFTGDQLALKLILPPFILIKATVRVIRAMPQTGGQGYVIATEFVDLKPDDQEHLIRHILQAQAEQLRARRKAAASGPLS